MHELNRIIDLPLDDLHSVKQLEQTKLRILLAEYEDKLKEYQELAEIQGEEFDDELTRIEENIVYMQKQIGKMNQHCRLLMAEKKNNAEAIKQFEAKRGKLASIYNLQNSKLTELIECNYKIEDEIKKARQEYEFYQQQVYNLDVRADNLRNYGCQMISEEIAALFQKKEELMAAIAQVDESIRIQEQEFNTMIEEDKIRQLQKDIKGLQEEKEELKTLQMLNEQLKKQNEKLNQIKVEYQWNPNLEIRTLQTKLQELQAKINSIQKQNMWINKRSNECQQRIHQYKRHLRKENKDRPQTLDNDKASSTKKMQSSKKRSIYDSIKQDLSEEKIEQCFLDRVKKIYQNKEKEQSDGDPRTFRKVKRTNIIQFWIVVVILSVVTYYCSRTAKK